MSYALLQSTYEPVEYHAMMLNAFSKRRKYWQKLIDLNEDTVQSGLALAYSKERYKMKLSEDDEEFEWKKELFDVYNRLWSITAIPMCFKKKNDGAVLLHPSVAKDMSEAEIEDLLAHKNIIGVKYTSNDYFKLQQIRERNAMVVDKKDDEAAAKDDIATVNYCELADQHYDFSDCRWLFGANCKSLWCEQKR